MSLFSPLQIDLVRRLRDTGISLEQISKIYNSLESLENALIKKEDSKFHNGHLGSEKNGGNEEQEGEVRDRNGEWKREQSPSPPSSPHKIPRLSTPPSEEVGKSGEAKVADSSSSATPVLLSHLNGPSPFLNLASSTRPPLFHSPSRLPSQDSDPDSANPPRPPFFPNSPFGSANPASILSQLSPAMQHMASIAMHQQRMVRPVSAQERWKERTRTPRSSGIDLSSVEDVDALKELLKDGEEAAIQEIKNHANKFQLRQTAIAGMSGVSQPYISKFLNGNYRELSSRVRTTLYSWYLRNKKNPTQHIGEWERSMGYTGLKEFPGGHRRERYVFRPVLLRILESHFNRHAYPDLERRMEIAAECNQALSVEKNGLVLAKELVSPQVIANWFANKRKEFKRKTFEFADSSVENGRQQMGFNFPLRLPQPVPTTGSTPFPSEENHLPVEDPPVEAEDPFAQQLKVELEAVNNSVLALVNPYGEEEEEEEEKEEKEKPLVNPFTQDWTRSDTPSGSSPSPSYSAH